MSQVSANPPGCVHVVGAGPVGLLLTALLQSAVGCPVRLYEKRTEYTRKRMVRLAPYLVADTLEDYRTDNVDGENIEAVFDELELDEGLAFRRSIAPDLMALLREWTMGFCPLNTIEQALSDLIDSRATGSVERIRGTLTADEAFALLEPGDILVDCTGSRSLLRDHLVPGGGTVAEDMAVDGPNTASLRLEYAIVTTFLFGGPYVCNELCKYYKNVDNRAYKFIPAVDRTCYDGDVSHVTGIVVISADEYEAMPARFDGEWLRGQFPDVANSMDRFIDKIRQETSGDLIGDLEIIRIPLMLYHARNATNRRLRNGGASEHPLAEASVFLLGDSAIGSPYFQSISLGFECAMSLAGLIAKRDMPKAEVLDRYELLTYKQWLRVYMRSKMIKHNKDLFETIDDKLAVLGKLRIY